MNASKCWNGIFRCDIIKFMFYLDRTRVCSWASCFRGEKTRFCNYIERKSQRAHKSTAVSAAKNGKPNGIECDNFCAAITNDHWCTCWRRAVTIRLTFYALETRIQSAFFFSSTFFLAAFSFDVQLESVMNTCAHANFSGRPTCFRL